MPTSLPGRSEAAIQEGAVKWAREHGIIAIKLSTRNYLGSNGWPDYLFCLPGGRVVFIEFKTEKGKLSALQSARIASLQGLGFSVFICHNTQTARDLLREELAAP